MVGIRVPRPAPARQKKSTVTKGERQTHTTRSLHAQNEQMKIHSRYQMRGQWAGAVRSPRLSTEGRMALFMAEMMELWENLADLLSK